MSEGWASNPKREMDLQWIHPSTEGDRREGLMDE